MSLKHVSVFAATIVGLAAGSARADHRTVMRVNVPFAFVAGGAVLPSGTYDIRSEGGSTAMWVEGEQHHPAVAVVLTTTAEGFDPAGDQPTLVFTRGESHLRLTQIWLSDRDGRDIAGSGSRGATRLSKVTVK